MLSIFRVFLHACIIHSCHRMSRFVKIIPEVILINSVVFYGIFLLFLFDNACNKEHGGQYPPIQCLVTEHPGNVLPRSWGTQDRLYFELFTHASHLHSNPIPLSAQHVTDYILWRFHKSHSVFTPHKQRLNYKTCVQRINQFCNYNANFIASLVSRQPSDPLTQEGV